jgi:RNA polymerase-binding transcription factor DksA
MFTPLECRLRAAECQKMAEYAPNPHVRTALATGPKARKAIKFSDSLVEVAYVCESCGTEIKRAHLAARPTNKEKAPR